MARKSKHQFERRKREQARKERANARRDRKVARSEARGTSSGDRDLEGIVAGPQPREEITDTEYERAVERAMSPGKTQRQSGPPVGATGRLFIGNLDFNTNEHDLRRLFEPAGYHVVSIKLLKDRATGQSRGCAFIELANAEEATRAIEKYNGEVLGGRAIRVNQADSPAGRY